MNSARKDRIITIQQKAYASPADAYGATPFEWEDFLTDVYARKMEVRGKEVFAAQQVTPESQRQYQIGWRDDIDETMRVVDDRGVGWDIIHIAEVGGRKCDLELTVKMPGERDGDGKG